MTILIFLRYVLALFLYSIGSVGGFFMLDDLRGPAGTPFNLFYLGICLFFIFLSLLIGAPSRSFMIGYIMVMGLLTLVCLFIRPYPTFGYILLAHVVLGALALAIRWKALG